MQRECKRPFGSFSLAALPSTLMVACGVCVTSYAIMYTSKVTRPLCPSGVPHVSCLLNEYSPVKLMVKVTMFYYCLNWPCRRFCCPWTSTTPWESSHFSRLATLFLQVSNKYNKYSQPMWRCHLWLEIQSWWKVLPILTRRQRNQQWQILKEHLFVIVLYSFKFLKNCMCSHLSRAKQCRQHILSYLFSPCFNWSCSNTSVESCTIIQDELYMMLLLYGPLNKQRIYMSCSWSVTP